jgi:hypothetical protein
MAIARHVLDVAERSAGAQPGTAHVGRRPGVASVRLEAA